MKNKKDVLNILARTLLEKEVVEKDELIEILNGQKETSS